MSYFGGKNLWSTFNFFQVFVNFAKEQTDEDNLTEVLTDNHTVPQTNLTNPAARISPPAVQPQPPVTPPQPSKTPPQQEKSPELKESKSKKSKASKAKSKGGKANKEQGSGTAMTKIPDSEKVGQSKQRGSVESNGSNGEAQGESSKPRRSKQAAASSSKDPSALFIVNSNTQESTMWTGLVRLGERGPTQSSLSAMLPWQLWRCHWWNKY